MCKERVERGSDFFGVWSEIRRGTPVLSAWYEPRPFSFRRLQRPVVASDKFPFLFFLTFSSFLLFLSWSSQK